MHNAWFDALGINLRYVAFEPADIGIAVNAIRALNFVWASISKPYKESVIKYLDELDPVAEIIGAVNIVHNDEGILKWYNSDWIGAISALEECVSLDKKRIAVLGAGWASRAITYGLKSRGSEVYIFNRTSSRGQSLAQDFGVFWGGDFWDVHKVFPEIIINATPVWHIDDDESPIPQEVLKDIKVVMDINVRKNVSKLLRDAKNDNIKVVDWIRMLVLQGAFTFELFTWQKAPVEIMEMAVKEALEIV